MLPFDKREQASGPASQKEHDETSSWWRRRLMLLLNQQRINDAKALRRGALANKIPYCTNMSTAYSFLEAIKSLKTKKLGVKSIQDN